MVEYTCFVYEGLLCGGYAAKHGVDALCACLYHMHTHSVYNTAVPACCCFAVTAVGVCCVHKLKSKMSKDSFYISLSPIEGGVYAIRTRVIQREELDRFGRSAQLTGTKTTKKFVLRSSACSGTYRSYLHTSSVICFFSSC
jgi:hypothetical protein